MDSSSSEDGRRDSAAVVSGNIINNDNNRMDPIVVGPTPGSSSGSSRSGSPPAILAGGQENDAEPAVVVEPANTMVYVVTGANSGVGYETVRRLARMKVKKGTKRDIILACRDITAAHNAIKKMAKFIDEDTVMHGMHLELGNSISVRNFGNEMKKRFPKIDCLICNAAILVPSLTSLKKSESKNTRPVEAEDRRHLIEENQEENNVEDMEVEEPPPSPPEENERRNVVGEMRNGGDRVVVEREVDDMFQPEQQQNIEEFNWLEPEKNPDGFELNVGNNHLAHVFLISVLMSLLRNSPSSRIVVVSSTLLKKATLRMEMMKPDFVENSDYKEGDPKEYYAESKLMSVLFVRGLRKELDRRGIENLKVYCVSPGWCYTNLSRHLHPVPRGCLPCLSFLALCFMRSARKGSESVFFCATEDPSKLENGGFYKNSKIEATMEAFLDSKYDFQIVDEVFSKSQEAVNADLFA